MRTLKSWAIPTLSVLTSFPADVYTEIMGFTEADKLGLLLSSLISAVIKKVKLSEHHRLR